MSFSESIQCIQFMRILLFDVFNQLVFPNLFKRFTSKCFCYLLLASIFSNLCCFL